MLYAIVSDIHANLTAWKAVLADLAAMKADRIICLGDVVGYGPEPAAVLESVYRHVDAFVMGNHDAVVAGKMSSESFNDHAQKMIEWTAGRVSEKGRHFLAKQPLVLSGPGFICTHGSPECPQAFNYITTPDEAISAWNSTDAPLVFVGHTHEAGLIVLGASGVPHMLGMQDFVMEEGKRYIVNVGSVGDPRDDDPRASYCLFDDSTGAISFRRVAFDYGALEDAVRKAGLDTDDVYLLRRDMVGLRQPVREALGFAPPRRAQAMAQDVAESADISELKRSNSKLRFVVATLIVLVAAIAGVMAGMLVKQKRQAAGFIPEQPLAAFETVTRDAIDNCPLPEIPQNYGELPVRGEISGWRYYLSDPESQRLSIEEDPETGRPRLVVHCEKRSRFILEAPEWRHNGYADGRRVTAWIFAMRSADFNGGASMKVIANRHNLYGEKLLFAAPLVLTKAGVMKRTSRTMKKSDSLRISPKAPVISFVVEGEFSGTLTLADPRLFAIE